MSRVFLHAGVPGLVLVAALPILPARAQDSNDTSATTLDRVQVTARKREERQLDVPIAMMAVTGEQMDAMGLRNVVDVINLTPGAASIDTGAGFTSVQIRGVSTSLGGNDNGYYVDETPFTGVNVPWYPDTRSFDIDRVEILKGPQGTLFGEGSMGGTVRILTRRPEFDRFGFGTELDASTAKGGSSGRGAKAVVNVPLVDERLALRVVATDEILPGWIDNALTGEKNLNEYDVRTWRAKLRFAPADNWNIDLGYWKYAMDAKASNPAYDDMTNIAFIASDNDWRSASLVSTYEFAGSQLVYALSDGEIHYPQEGELAPGLDWSGVYDIDIRSHELRWGSTGVRNFDWTLGVYQRKTERTDQLAFFGLPPSITRQTNKARAIFGEATLKLPNPAWSLTAGLRHFKDDINAIGIATGSTASTLNGRYDSWNPRVSLAFQPNANTTLYASAAKGFRSAQLQPISSLQIAEVIGIELPRIINADSIWSYEFGLKSMFADGKLLLESALFYNDWKDVAVRVPITPALSGLTNSDGSKTHGIELNLVWQPLRDLSLQAGGSWMDARYSAAVPGTPLQKGTPVYNVPKTRFNSSVHYGWDVGTRLRGAFNASVQHDSARKTSLSAGTPAGDAITLANLRIGLESPAGWALYVYANNLTNEDGALDARGASEFDANGEFVRYGAANRPQPRTFGVTHCAVAAESAGKTRRAKGMDARVFLQDRDVL